MALPGGAEEEMDPEEQLPGVAATDEEMPPHFGPARFFRRVMLNRWPQLWRALCRRTASEEHVRTAKH
eukprot:3064936-Lingulodinium_polyedra.AAC.1